MTNFIKNPIREFIDVTDGLQSDSFQWSYGGIYKCLVFHYGKDEDQGKIAIKYQGGYLIFQTPDLFKTWVDKQG
jgi:hypothetical protein